MRSLRFRLPALFLAAITLAFVVASLIAVRLFQDHTRDESLRELRREAAGLAQLYAESAAVASDEGRAAPAFAAEKLEAATGDKLYYVGANPFPGEETGLTRLTPAEIGRDVRRETEIVTFEFEPPGEDRPFLAASHPLRFDPGALPFGALFVAKPQTELRDA